MSSFTHSLKLVLAPPHPAGRPFLIVSGVVAVLGLVLGLALPSTTAWVVAVLAFVFFLFCLYFFRDPERLPSLLPGIVVAPADGKVVLVGQVAPPAELGLGIEPRWRIAIFLSVLDVHVNRMPVAAEVTRIAYHKGQFLNASVDKASDLNERNGLALRLADGRTMAVVQIAGLIARRILCHAKEGAFFTIGERFGIIRFGSRTDLYLPHGVEPLVRVGQTMIGGETVLARL
ncbi:phosphatidylserine decarboxylase [Lichenicola cladoniae]|uniref:Phosphatidylserine decarboxylase proenzyme n=1 Tax=Lichenicola cladoniae TaxID=1484109 RepID=A0A6M8HMZ4_9PROT|nr:phosphatidylserine decarboxylase [Lichenicola cladoniae]NPD67141.1 phosphatidylserine decarboxylase [Acetobacteraceae bacterium]QKE89671.1 phosphatidylserine decarboxylase [Lichenicola cladoniae]